MWFDGCNNCYVTETSKILASGERVVESKAILACTKMACPKPANAKCLDKAPTCDDCDEWFDGCNLCVCNRDINGHGTPGCAETGTEQACLNPGNPRCLQRRTACEEDDVFKCFDGSNVPRDPENNCLFKRCPPRVCTQDMCKCPDGGLVSRDPHHCSCKPCKVYIDGEIEYRVAFDAGSSIVNNCTSLKSMYRDADCCFGDQRESVSYTHLTLPTKA